MNRLVVSVTSWWNFCSGVPHGVFDASLEDALSAALLQISRTENLGHDVRAGFGLQTQWIPTAAHFRQRQLGEKRPINQ